MSGYYAQVLPRVLPAANPLFIGGEASAFARGKNERRLRVVVDAATLSADQLNEVHGFGAHPLIYLETTGEAEGLAHISCPEPLGDEGSDVIFIVKKGDAEDRRGVRFVNQKVTLAAQYATEAESPSQLLPRVLLAASASTFGCDALISNSRALGALVRQGFYKEANVASYTGGMAVIGLYLRQQGDFSYFCCSGAHRTVTTGSAYDLVARAILGDSWKWLETCPVPSDPLEESPLGLSESVVHRMSMALRARDRLHWCLLGSSGHEAVHEALFYFDALLVSLHAAFESVARVAHLVYGMVGSPHEANWRQKKWKKAVIERCSALACMTGEHRPGRTQNVLALLRNSVHGEPLKLVGDASRVGDLKYSLAVPDADRQAILSGIGALGGADAWGVRRVDQDLVLVDPGPFVEQLIPAAAEGLNAAMKAIETERLPNAREWDGGPPPWWTEEAQKPAEKLALLFGLGKDDAQ